MAERVGRAELAAWWEMHRAASPELATARGMRSARFGAAAAFAVADTPSLEENHVLGLGLFEPATAGVLDGIVRFYEGAQFAVELSPAARPAEVGAWLVARGFEHLFDIAVLHRSTAVVPEAPTELRVELVAPDGGQVFAEAKARANGSPAPSAWEASLVGRPGWRQYLAWDGALPVATGAMFVEGDVGWLGFAVTAPSHRGRGAQSALIARRVRDAGALGCAWVTTETEADTAEQPSGSYRNLRRLGFELTGLRPNYVSPGR
jgi:ribosomal protein S18 acetylase RimI-like enzyme